MNCSLFYHLQQQEYIANIKGETAEALRYNMEAVKHAHDCPFCNGYIPAGVVFDNLFGGLVIVTAEA